MLIAVASTRGAPGVTTTALLIARLAADAGWNATVVEADPDGGVLGFLFPGLSPDNNLLDYCVAARRDDSDGLFDEHSQRLGPDTAATVVAAPPLGEEVTRALQVGSDHIIKMAAKRGRLIVVDCGRIGNAAAKVFNAADRSILLARPDRPSALGLKALHDAHPERSQQVSTLLVGDKPYGPADLAESGVPVAGVIADDPRTADQVRGVTELNVKRLPKTALAKTVAAFVPSLSEDTATDNVEDVEVEDDSAFAGEWSLPDAGGDATDDTTGTDDADDGDAAGATGAAEVGHDADGNDDDADDFSDDSWAFADAPAVPAVAEADTTDGSEANEAAGDDDPDEASTANDELDDLLARVSDPADDWATAATD